MFQHLDSAIFLLYFHPFNHINFPNATFFSSPSYFRYTPNFFPDFAVSPLTGNSSPLISFIACAFVIAFFAIVSFFSHLSPYFPISLPISNSTLAFILTLPAASCGVLDILLPALIALMLFSGVYISYLRVY